MYVWRNATRTGLRLTVCVLHRIMTKNVTCRLCLEEIEFGDPDQIYGLNPETLRIGWMHYWCASFAEDDLHGMPARLKKYQLICDDAHDEYLEVLKERGN